MKYAIIGSALSGNKGASAMLESAIHTLSKDSPEAEFVLLSMYPEADRELNTYQNLKIVKASPLYLGLVINPAALLYRILPFARKTISKRVPPVGELASSSVLLDQGGITFADGREKFLIYNIASVLPAMMMKVPVVKCAQALGPFKTRINRIISKLFLPKFAAIISRGELTHKALEGLKLKNVTSGADYAFSLDPPSTKDKELVSKLFNLQAFKRASKNTLVGVAPSVVLKKKCDNIGIDYIEVMTEFVDELTKEGHQIVLVPHSVRTGTEKVHNNDLPLTKTIYKNLEDRDMCLFINKELSSQQLRYIIGQCDVFVACRFHAMVSALATATPVLVVGWSHKYQEVLSMFGVESHAVGYQELATSQLSKAFNDFSDELVEYKSRLTKNLPAVIATSKKHIDVILKTAIPFSDRGTSDKMKPEQE